MKYVLFYHSGGTLCGGSVLDILFASESDQGPFVHWSPTEEDHGTHV